MIYRSIVYSANIVKNISKEGTTGKLFAEHI